MSVNKTPNIATKTPKKSPVRDDFKAPVKQLLRDQAGNLCSFPGCNKSTVGPSAEKRGRATNRTGEAAHITGASAGPGSRRYDDKLSRGERSAYENGIWCCGIHAKLIDGDEQTYSVSLLKHWRAVAELRAKIAQSHSIDVALRMAVDKLGLAPDKLTFTTPPSSSDVDDFFLLSWIPAFLSLEEWQAARDFTYEHILNAFRHGDAKTVQVEFFSHSLAIRDDGRDFALAELAPNGPHAGGGLFTYQALVDVFGYPPALFHASGVRECRLQMKPSRTVILAQNPCSVDVPIPGIFTTPAQQAQEASTFLRVLASRAGCETLFLVGPRATMISHIRDVGPRIEDALSTGKRVVICFPNTSARTVEEYRRRYAGIETLMFDEPRDGN
jgi:hypothetical protein